MLACSDPKAHMVTTLPQTLVELFPYMLRGVGWRVASKDIMHRWYWTNANFCLPTTDYQNLTATAIKKFPET